MSSPIFEALGINPDNLEIETSIVTLFECDTEKPTKICEGLIQNVYKLENQMSLGFCNHLIASSTHLIYAIGNELYLNSSLLQVVLKSAIIDLALDQDVLYLLNRDSIIFYSIPDMNEIYSLKLTEAYKKIKISSFGTTIFLIGTNTITRIEDKTQVTQDKYEEEITSFENILDCYDLICMVFESKIIKIINYSHKKIVSEYESDIIINQICSVNDSVVIIYCQDRSTLVAFNFKERINLYSIVFNSKIPKKIIFCEETEQIIILNKNSCKFMILSLDDKAFVTKYITFGLKNNAKDIKHVVMENDIKHQPLYEGNSMHKFFVFHETTIDVYLLEVISTKTIGFRYGKEPEPLLIYQEKNPIIKVNEDNLVIKKLEKFIENEENIKKDQENRNIKKE